MKRNGKIIVILIVIILIPFIGRLLWMVQKKIPMDLIIINKSVSDIAGNEVKSLNWVLNYDKVLKSGNEHYDFTKDYFGYHPKAISDDRCIKTFNLKDFPSFRNDYDGLIYLDNAGVDLKNSTSGISHYGGLNQTEYMLMLEMYKSGKLVLAEYNFISYPTEELVRYNAQQFMDVYTLSWQGKFFKNLNQKKLSQEIEDEWFHIYKEFYKKDWDMEGPGIVLLNKNQNRIIVLPQKDYMKDKFPTVVSDPEMAKRYELPEKTAYTGWFELVYEGNNEVISYLDLNLNDDGQKLMKINGLKWRFPVCIKISGKPFYYLGGDFSKQNVFMGWSRVRILNDICHSVCKGMTKNPNTFFQTYYVPLISNILEDYRSSINIEENI